MVMLRKREKNLSNATPATKEERRDAEKNVAFFKKALRARGFKVGFSKKTDELLLRKESRGTVVARFSRSKLEQFFANF